MNDRLRQLPAVDQLLQHERLQLLIETFGREAVLESVRSILDQARAAIRVGEGDQIDIETLVVQIDEYLENHFQLSLRPVINATGVILHTNLGRAPLSKSAIAAVQAVASSYNTLEFDLDSGKRGHRHTHVEAMVAEVVGAEAAMVVNNCAAAVLLTLSALAKDREVVISRGQLVEIGGGFRIPDVMTQSGGKLVEVGTTNRTRITDYEKAISDNTALLMRAHASNFKIIGFTEQAELSDIAGLAHQYNLFCVDDLGSGALLDTAQFGLAHEPTVQESLAAGADIITFSGDKLLGGPQAGIIVGKKAALDILKRHPLARALRVDKMTIAALVVTLDHYRRGQALTHLPIWQMISKPLDEIREIAQKWASVIDGDVLQGESTIGGGSLPGETLPTVIFSPRVASAQVGLDQLRHFDPPIIARIKDDRLLLDPRTVRPAQVEKVTVALQRL